MLDLRPGDQFLSQSKGFLGRAINRFQRFWSQDGVSRYTHAGIIVDEAGAVFEAVGKGVSEGDLYHYAGSLVMIVRHNNMNPGVFQDAFGKIQAHRGAAYPVHRLLFHLFPPLSRFGFGMVVCSELAAKFLYSADILEYWQGVNPDELADIFRHWKGFEIIFEGTLPEKEKGL